MGYDKDRDVSLKLTFTTKAEIAERAGAEKRSSSKKPKPSIAAQLLAGLIEMSQKDEEKGLYQKDQDRLKGLPGKNQGRPEEAGSRNQRVC